jgi:hypothetical protein
MSSRVSQTPKIASCAPQASMLLLSRAWLQAKSFLDLGQFCGEHEGKDDVGADTDDVGGKACVETQRAFLRHRLQNRQPN